MTALNSSTGDGIRREQSDWGSGATLAEIANTLRGASRVVISTHTKPDGDAAGSSLAVARALNIAAGGSADGFAGAGSKSEIFYAGPLPSWLKTIAGGTRWRHVDDREPLEPGPAATSDGSEPDAVLIVDTGSWTQLEPIAGWLRQRHDRAAVIDHHLKGDPDVAPLRHVDTAAAAAAVPCAELCRLLLGKASISDLPVEVAQPLYLGLASDTGWFRHANTTPAALRLAADLSEAGATHEALNNLTEQQDRPSRFRLLAKALNTLELFEDDRIALMRVSAKDFEASGAGPGETGGFVDVIRTIGTVRVAGLLTEVPGEKRGEGGGVRTKVSMRSKGPGLSGAEFVDVNLAASELGGGGHAQAAGVRLEMGLDDAVRTIVEKLAEQLDRRG